MCSVLCCMHSQCAIGPAVSRVLRPIAHRVSRRPRANAGHVIHGDMPVATALVAVEVHFVVNGHGAQSLRGTPGTHVQSPVKQVRSRCCSVHRNHLTSMFPSTCAPNQGRRAREEPPAQDEAIGTVHSTRVPPDDPARAIRNVPPRRSARVRMLPKPSPWTAEPASPTPSSTTTSRASLETAS